MFPVGKGSVECFELICQGDSCEAQNTSPIIPKLCLYFGGKDKTDLICSSYLQYCSQYFRVRNQLIDFLLILSLW